MTLKRKVLKSLTKVELLDVARDFQLGVASSMTVDQVRDELARSKTATLDRFLSHLGLDSLRRICKDLEVAVSGNKQGLVDRILAQLPPSLGGPTPAAEPTRKRRVLASLSKAELLAVARTFDLSAATSMTVTDLIEVVAASKAASLPKLLQQLTLDVLRAICDEIELPRSGTKATLIRRIAGTDGANGRTGADGDGDGNRPEPNPPPPVPRTASVS